MRRYQDSPPQRPRVLETDIDYPSRSSNGDLTRNQFIGPRGFIGGSVIGVGPNGNKRTMDLDHDAEAATPSDTMLTPSKLPLPDDDEDDMGQDRQRPAGVLNKIAVKHGLTRKGVSLVLCLGLICLILQIIVLLMAIFWPREPMEDPKEICLTPDCLRASAQLQGSLDLNSNPCQDFWSYSCGGWLEDNPLPKTASYWSVSEKLRHQALAEMRSLLDTMDEPEDLNSIEWKLSNFYSSCMNQRSYKEDSVAFLRRIIQTDLHGWNLMRDTWDRRRWDFDLVLRKLHVTYGVSPFFKVDVVPDPDPNRAGHNIIKLSPSGYSMPHRSYYKRLPNNDFLNLRLPRVHENKSLTLTPEEAWTLSQLQQLLLERHVTKVEQAYKQYIKDTVKMFDASGPDALDFASHLYHYESRIAEITPPDRILKDPLKSNTRLTIGRLSLVSGNIPWLDLLRQMFPNSNLDHRTDILVASEQYFSSLSSLLSTTERSDLSNYLIFNFVSSYMPYMSDNGKRVYNLFQTQFTGAKEAPERWEFCMETTARFYGYGLGYLYEGSHTRQKARQRNTEQIEAMFTQLRNTLRFNLRASKWYPTEMKSVLAAKLKNMSIIVGYPENLLESGYMDGYYKDYSVFKNPFSQNLQESIKSDHKRLERRLINPEIEPAWMEALQGSEIRYIYEANKIVIPPHLLNPPIFHRNYPSCIMYGSLGVRVTREMLKAFDIVGLSYGSNGNLLPRTEATNRTIKHIENLADCIASTTMSLSIEEDKVINKTASDTAAEIDAVRQTYEAYLSLMRRYPQFHPPSFESLNSTNIFFMAYAGSLCSEVTNQKEDIFRTRNDNLMEHPRLLSVLAQMPEFTQVFDCTKDTRHYPVRICDSIH